MLDERLDPSLSYREVHKMKGKLAQLFRSLGDPLDDRVHGIFQARILQ